jgi:hypothetical protein
MPWGQGMYWYMACKQVYLVCILEPPDPVICGYCRNRCRKCFAICAHFAVPEVVSDDPGLVACGQMWWHAVECAVAAHYVLLHGYIAML